MNDTSIEPLLQVIRRSTLSDEVYEAAQSLREFGSEKAIQPLLSRIEKEPDPYWLRKMLLEALYCSFPRKGVTSSNAEEVLLSILTSEEEHQDVKAAAVLALGYVGSDLTTELLIQKIPDISTPSILHGCIVALGNIGNPKAVDALVKIMKTELPFIPQVVAEALGKIGPPSMKAIPELQMLVEDGSEAERHAALKAIAKIKQSGKVD
jgi:HEAT repeat protein